MSFNEVYHSSQIQNLKEITPQTSTHGEKWVYATKDIVMTAPFLGTLGGDLACAVGRDDAEKPYICERFVGAFDMRYENVSGSIYILSGENFVEGKTQWEEEVVCPETVIPICEIKIENAKQHLLKLAEEGSLIIKFYPKRVAGIPEDDEDLVYRAAIWHKRFGDKVLDDVKKYHPNLVDRVLRAIKDKKE